jgi:hypothetical protein
MATVTRSDLKELKELIVAFREDTNKRFTGVENRLSGIENRLTIVETRLDEWRRRPAMAKIPDLAEKVGELKNWKQVGLIVVTVALSSILSGTIGGVVGWLIRSGKS